MNRSSTGSWLSPSLQMGIAARAIKLALLAATLYAVCATDFASATAAQSKEPRMRIVAFGDSLTAGFGLAGGQGFVPVLQNALRARGHAVEIVDAGVSGDTTAAGLGRLDWVIDDTADAVIVELGANDALRGQPPEQAKANLDQILTRLGTRGLPVLLAGMRAPENWGAAYRERFDAMYAELAQKYGAILYPFFLEGVALERKLSLDDGLHPNAKGIAIIVERILPYVEELIGRARAKRAGVAAGTR